MNDALSLNLHPARVWDRRGCIFKHCPEKAESWRPNTSLRRERTRDLDGQKGLKLGENPDTMKRYRWSPKGVASQERDRKVLIAKGSSCSNTGKCIEQIDTPCIAHRLAKPFPVTEGFINVDTNLRDVRTVLSATRLKDERTHSDLDFRILLKQCICTLLA